MQSLGPFILVFISQIWSNLPGCPKHRTRRAMNFATLLKCGFTSTETVGLFVMGDQDDHLDFHTAPELCLCHAKSGAIYTSKKILGQAQAAASVCGLDQFYISCLMLCLLQMLCVPDSR